MKCFISLDMGGTKALGVAAVFPDGPCFKLEAPSKNLRLMVDLELGGFLHAIVNQIPASEFRKEAVWLIGAAGARPQADKKRIQVLMQDLDISSRGLEIFPDYEGNWAAAFGGRDGIISVNGTGSIIFGRWEGRENRRGGWGYLLDEIPSGALFGKWVLQKVLSKLDAGSKEEVFSPFFAEKFWGKAMNRADLLNALYASTSPQRFLGEFAPAFVEAFSQGDPEFRFRFDSSLHLWANQLQDLALELNMTTPALFCGFGGLWDNGREFKPHAAEYLHGIFPGRFEINQSAFTPEWGPLIKYFVEMGKDRSEWEPMVKNLRDRHFEASHQIMSQNP